MPYISIDVDLDDFDTEDLLQELEHRFERKRKISKSEMESLIGFCKQVLAPNPQIHPSNGSLLDRLKLECYAENKDRFTLTELQERLK